MGTHPVNRQRDMTDNIYYFPTIRSKSKICIQRLVKKKVSFQTVPFQSGLKLLLCTAPSMYNSGRPEALALVALPEKDSSISENI